MIDCIPFGNCEMSFYLPHELKLSVRGMKLIECFVSNLLSFTHWWNWQSSIVIDVLPILQYTTIHALSDTQNNDNPLPMKPFVMTTGFHGQSFCLILKITIFGILHLQLVVKEKDFPKFFGNWMRNTIFSKKSQKMAVMTGSTAHEKCWKPNFQFFFQKEKFRIWVALTWFILNTAYA